MRIAFTVIGNSRRSNYLNGNTLRYGNGGGSGTDTSSIVIAEYLASQGHDVYMATEDLEPALEQRYSSEGKKIPYGTKIRGVGYTNLKFDGVEDKNFDILVNSLWFGDYDTLPIVVTQAVIYWCHMQWIYGIEEVIKYAQNNNLKLGFVHISNWEKEMNLSCVDNAKTRYDKTFSTLIPNPIMDDMINEITDLNLPKKKHKFIFHAAWARGGDVAVDAIRKLNYPDSELHAFDYLMATHAHPDSFFKMHNGVDKQTLFTHLAESDYFIYPLYTPYQDVHKDTFSCVVAEAIALGAITITYPLGALPENFDGYCVWLDFPSEANPAIMQKESLSKDLKGIFKCTDNIISKINFIENNPHIKEDIRNRGRDYILNKFNTKKVGDMWLQFINEELNIK